MSLVLNDPDQAGQALRVGYRHTGGSTAVTIRLNGEPVAEQTWDGEEGVYEVDYALPKPLLTAPRETSYELEIAAQEGRRRPDS
ncbi:hypothetical protein J5V16_16580 [Glycomyces sp. NEAU-S30]|uniref:Uncharacterized protein n=2 Tax=Glycomyces niveus TaxID=2820287 RepID=A0ABS3U885_9ACTN|nr:hypothetical protein [Glycomyces sp. NEAU-S30]